MFKYTYQTMNQKLEPDKALVHSTLAAMRAKRQGEAVKTRKPRSSRRILSAALAAVLVLALSLSAVAAAVPSFREILFGVTSRENQGAAAPSGMGGVLTEIENVWAEHDGFRLEILGATHDQEAMAVYYTLTDISGENRLDRNTGVIPHTSLFDSLQQMDFQPGDDMTYSAYRADLLDYNSETSSALCRYVLDTKNAESVDFSKVDFSVFSILLGNEDIVYSPISLDQSKFTSETLEMDGQIILKPGDSSLELEGVEDSAITAIGFIDGRLHIQTKAKKDNAEFFQAGILPIDKAITPEEVASAGGYTLEFERREAEAYYSRTGAAAEENGEMRAHTTRNGEYFFNMEEGLPVQVEDIVANAFTYHEEVYDISPQELQYYNFYYSQSSYEKELRYGSFEFEDSAGRSSFDGPGEYSNDLQVTFEVNDVAVADPKTITDLQVDGGTITSLTAGGLGITVSADRALAEKAAITAVCGDDTISYSKTIVSGVPVSGDITTVDSYTGPVTVKYIADRPINTADITSITINGTEVPLA